jgi:hypothetical protein
VSGRGALLVALGAVAGTACHRRPAEGTVATLLEAVGEVQRSDGAGWVAAPVGHGFVVGDALRTGPGSLARLGFASGSVVRVAENGRIRFVRGTLPARGQPDQPKLAIELGAAEIEQAADDLDVLTVGGAARVRRGTHLRVQADGRTATLEVLVGRAVLLGRERAETLEAGEGLRVEVGGAIVERFRINVGDAVVEPAPTAPEVPAADQGASPPQPARATRADVTLAAGESAVLHDGKPPLAVRLRFDHLCPGDGVVELGSTRHPQRLPGAGAVVLRLPMDARQYQVRYAGDPRGHKPRAAGVLTLKRDNGNVPLAKRPPSNTIDADGRRYTVLYQTRLPALTLAWTGAPSDAGALALHLEASGGGAGTRALPDRRPSQPLPPGALGEGTYTWWYATADGRESPRTTLTIRFDNAAPTAQFFRRGAVPAAAPARAVLIDGVTVEGAKVSAGGQPLAVDERGRFHGSVPPSDGDDAVAVRLEHPRSGIHYYIRR